MKPTVTIRKALRDKNLLGHVIAAPSWSTWRALLIAALGEKLTDAERAVFTKITGREHEPLQRVQQLEVIAGRRGGKTRAMATLASYLSGLCDHRDVLIPGETGVLLCIAQDQRIAKKILDFVEEDFDSSPILSQLVVNRAADALELKNNIRIEVRPASFRKLRGPTYIGVIADELAFWFTEENYANPDIEVLAAARPGLLTTHGPLILASSPYAQRGVLWENYRKHYGPSGSPLILIAKGTTRDFNATVSQEEIDALLEEDRVRNTAEYLAEFRSDIEGFAAREVIDAAVAHDRHELPRIDGVRYFAFVDPSGGGPDSFTMAISHIEAGGSRIVLDLVRERRGNFSPDDVVAEYCALLRAYGIASVRGDRYGGIWPRERFSVHGIEYVTSTLVKSEIYLNFLPLLNASRVELLDHSRLLAQLSSLERRTQRGGKDSVDHAQGAHDDLINAAAGALVLAAQQATQAMSFAVPLVYAKNTGWSDASPAAAPATKPSKPAWHDWVYSGSTCGGRSIRDRWSPPSGW